MWIAKPEYARLRDAAAEATLLKTQAAATQATLDWLRVRVNQLEQERAALVAKVLQVSVQVPVLESVRPSHPLESRADPVPPTKDAILARIESMFDDVGDDVARQLGITNDPVTGELLYETSATHG